MSKEKKCKKELDILEASLYRISVKRKKYNKRIYQLEKETAERARVAEKESGEARKEIILLKSLIRRCDRKIEKYRQRPDELKKQEENKNEGD